eukprot:7101278-Pyramimonas_sp.AAC.1
MEHWYVMVPVMAAQQFELTGRLDHSDRPDGAIPLRLRMVDAYERAYKRAREPLEPENTRHAPPRVDHRVVAATASHWSRV